jgi:CPA2 family monovalent cation:H+ antiporter-2
MIERIARTRSEELLTLAVFVAALGIAALAAGVFQVSVALGAFFAGLVIGRSRLGPQAAAYMTPFRDVFSALFFVSVGMLFDPAFLIEQPWKVVVASMIVLVAKPLAALVIVRLLGDNAVTAATVAVGLAQIGEFSFLLGTLGVALGVLPQDALDTLVAAALVSIALNPVLFRGLVRWEAQQPSRAQPSIAAPARSDASAPSAHDMEGHVVVCGEGRLHRALVKRMHDMASPIVVVDADLDFVDDLSKGGVPVVFGDPGRADVLRAAGIERAQALVVTLSELPAKMATCLAARTANPRIAIVVTAADPAERAWLLEFGATAACDTTLPALESVERLLHQTLAER